MRIDHLAQAAEPEVLEALHRHASLASDYNRTHIYRYARTLDVVSVELAQVLLDRTDGVSLLEIGTSGVYPLVIADLFPSVAVTVTQEGDDRPVESSIAFDHDPANREFACLRVDIEQEPMPLPDASMDVVLLCEVIEHLELDPVYCLAEINRILVPGGLLVITTPNICSGRAALRMLMGSSPYFFMKYTTQYGRHNFEYTVHDLRAACQAAGFAMEALWTEDNFEDPDADVSEMIRRAGGTLDHRGDNIIGVFSKAGPVVDRYPSFLYVD